LFAELQNTPDVRDDPLVNANYEIDEKEEQKPMDMKGAVETAQRYLERDKSDRLAQVKNVVVTPTLSSSTTHQLYFKIE
jgi:hypothetical protein